MFRYVLTAAHCFFFSEYTPKDVEVLVHGKYLDLTDLKDLRGRTPSQAALAAYQNKLKKLALKKQLKEVPLNAVI
jgi:hypothetical protein